ncbi:MAG: nucleoside triphosphate pyrophosphohydrolase [Clostridiales bacterium]|jgi:tetrapyrrole methylase family protein/MazG family protein|nr:nucleoside triphosphate pyrophosphohydrolase [Clostridiales bacterium]
MNLKIIGLGYKDGDITFNGTEALKQADCVILKSERLAGAGYLKRTKTEYIALDVFFESAEDFDVLNFAVTEFVVKKAEEYKNAVYLVGGGGYDDLTAAELIKKGASLIPGVSPSAYAMERALGADGAENIAAIGLTEISADELIKTDGFFPDKRFCLAVKDIDDNYLASEVKLKLSDIYGDVGVIIMYADGKFSVTSLFELDRQKKSVYGYRTTLVVLPSPPLSNGVHDMSDLYLIMKRLRGKDGCKWDMAQTHKSIAINAIEEAYELADAIDLDDAEKMTEESGDVLLQALFHAMIGEDNGEFNVYDMMTVLGNKLLSRHTHIFGADSAADAAEALTVWEKAKTKEKKYKSFTDKMNSVPLSFPALLRADKIARTAEKCWVKNDDLKEVLTHLLAEIDELKAAKTQAGIHEEGGDVLLMTVMLLRLFKVEPETALRDAVSKFIRRFSYIESRVEQDGRQLTSLTADEQIKYWKEAKKAEGTGGA